MARCISEFEQNFRIWSFRPQIFSSRYLCNGRVHFIVSWRIMQRSTARKTLWTLRIYVYIFSWSISMAISNGIPIWRSPKVTLQRFKFNRKHKIISFRLLTRLSVEIKNIRILLGVFEWQRCKKSFISLSFHFVRNAWRPHPELNYNNWTNELIFHLGVRLSIKLNFPCLSQSRYDAQSSLFSLFPTFRFVHGEKC